MTQEMKERSLYKGAVALAMQLKRLNKEKYTQLVLVLMGKSA